jgi:hypothetical protein
MTITLTPAEQFFYDHAGYSWRVDQTEEEGHLETARQLAQAEEWARVHGLTYLWAEDWTVHHSKEFGQDVDSCEYVELVNEDFDVLASIGCVDDSDADYRRVIEAELALEANGSYYTTAS